MGELDSLLGTLLIGTWGASGLFMLEILWTWRYYHSFPKDSMLLKLLVSVTMFSDFVALIAAYANSYLYCVTRWGDTAFLEDQHWPVPLYIGSTALTAALVQGFLIYRFIQLSEGKWYIAAILALLMLSCFTATWVTAGMNVKLSSFSDRVLLKVPINIWFTTDAGADLAIALALTWQLRRRRRSGLHRTNTVIARLISISLRSGSITAVFALATLIAYEFKPEANVSTIFEWYMCRSYVLTLLYSLNSRKELLHSTKAKPADRNVTTTTIGHTDLRPIQFHHSDAEASIELEFESHGIDPTLCDSENKTIVHVTGADPVDADSSIPKSSEVKPAWDDSHF